MKRLSSWLKNFFFPPADASRGTRLLPYAVLGALTLVVLVSGLFAWEYTNSPEFCGTSCHTMPPEYTSYLTSPHARIDCVECHIGRDFIATRITRKAGDIKHIISLIFKTYEFPIHADDLRPARETCETCHFPEKFSDDSLREIKHFGDDDENTPESIYLLLKTGGGSKRQGLGRGIHWHIENQVLFLALDQKEQQIPYIRVVEDDGSVTEFVDISAEIDTSAIDPTQLIEMDCITCHNRITHLVYSPEEILDRLMTTEVISPTIPGIRRVAVEVLLGPYASNEMAINNIAEIAGYYQEFYPDFYAANEALVEEAIVELQGAYLKSVFPEQKADWDSHPNNIGHQDTAGCFRCHDGNHLNEAREAIRLECNICHSIPVVADASDFVTEIEISRGPEPQSHLNPNWIGLHREIFDSTCSNCHTTDNPGGIDNSSFCSNSACHGTTWEYAGFDAPGLREILLLQVPTPVAPEEFLGAPTYEGVVGSILQTRCGTCHGENGLQGLNLTTYDGLLAGGTNGAVVVPGEPEASLIIQKLTADQPHFAQLSRDEIVLVIEWITANVPEK